MPARLPLLAYSCAFFSSSSYSSSQKPTYRPVPPTYLGEQPVVDGRVHVGDDEVLPLLVHLHGRAGVLLLVVVILLLYTDDHRNQARK